MSHPPQQHLACRHFIEYDTSEWPLVHCRVKPVEPDTATFDAHLHCFSELLNRGQRFMVMFDLRNAKLISLAAMKKQAEFMETHKPQILENLVASSLITDNALVHGAVNVLFKIKKPSKPNHTFRTPEDAHPWMGQEWSKAHAVPSTVTLEQERSKANVPTAPKKFFFE